MIRFTLPVCQGGNGPEEVGRSFPTLESNPSNRSETIRFKPEMVGVGREFPKLSAENRLPRLSTTSVDFDPIGPVGKAGPPIPLRSETKLLSSSSGIAVLLGNIVPRFRADANPPRRSGLSVDVDEPDGPPSKPNNPPSVFWSLTIDVIWGITVCDTVGASLLVASAVSRSLIILATPVTCGRFNTGEIVATSCSAENKPPRRTGDMLVSPDGKTGAVGNNPPAAESTFSRRFTVLILCCMLDSTIGVGIIPSRDARFTGGSEGRAGGFSTAPNPEITASTTFRGKLVGVGPLPSEDIISCRLLDDSVGIGMFPSADTKLSSTLAGRTDDGVAPRAEISCATGPTTGVVALETLPKADITSAMMFGGRDATLEGKGAPKPSPENMPPSRLPATVPVGIVKV